VVEFLKRLLWILKVVLAGAVINAINPCGHLGLKYVSIIDAHWQKETYYGS